MKASPLYLKLIRQVLGEDTLGHIIELSSVSSPCLDYKPYQNKLKSKVLPDDQATVLKASTLTIVQQNDSFCEAIQIQGLGDFFDNQQGGQSGSQDTAAGCSSQSDSPTRYMVNQIIQHCCSLNPLSQLQNFQHNNSLSDTELIQILLDDQRESIQQIATHPNGNYAFQRLYQIATQQQREEILSNTNLFELSLNQHGTRSVQKIILISSSGHHQDIIKQQLSGKVVDLILNQHGNHCIQKMLDTFSPENFDFIIQECADQLLKVACHQHGCCVLQRSLDHCNQKQFYQLFNLVKQCAYQLVVDQYGNYVYQYLLDSNKLEQEHVDQLITTLYKKEAELTRMKSSSHVIEKCIMKGSIEVSRQIVANLIEDEGTFVDLCMDRYANYVIQKLVGVCTKSQLERITTMIKDNINSLSQSQFSRHIINFIVQQGK